MRLAPPWFVRALLSVVLVAAVLWHIDAGPVAAALGRANPWYVAAAVLLLLPNLHLQYAKWRLLVTGSAPGVTLRDVRVSLFAGFALGMVTPARLGEFGGRAVLCRGAGKGLLVGLTAADKAATMIMTVLGGLAALLHAGVSSAGLPALPVALFGLVVLALLCGVLLLFTPWFPAPLRAALERREGLFSRRILRILEAVGGMRGAALARLLALSALFYLTFVLQFLLLLAAFGPLHPLHATCGIMAVMFLKTVIPPVTIGELGIREGASVLVLSAFGVVSAAAFSASLLLFGINILLPALAGSWYLFRGRAAGNGQS